MLSPVCVWPSSGNGGDPGQSGQYVNGKRSPIGPNTADCHIKHISKVGLEYCRLYKYILTVNTTALYVNN